MERLAEADDDTLRAIHDFLLGSDAAPAPDSLRRRPGTKRAPSASRPSVRSLGGQV